MLLKDQSISRKSSDKKTYRLVFFPAMERKSIGDSNIAFTPRSIVNDTDKKAFPQNLIHSDISNNSINLFSGYTIDDFPILKISKSEQEHYGRTYSKNPETAPTLSSNNDVNGSQLSETGNLPPSVLETERYAGLLFRYKRHY